MEIPDEMLTEGMIKSLRGTKPVMIAIIGEDENGALHPNLVVDTDFPDENRPVLASLVQELVFITGYPDLPEALNFFSLHLVQFAEAVTVNPEDCAHTHADVHESPVLGLTAGAPFGNPGGFVAAMTSILAGVAEKLGVGMTVAGPHRGPRPGTVVNPLRRPDEPPTGQYL